MKRVLLPVMLGILVVVVFTACTNVRNVKDVPRVSKDYLKAKLGSPDLVLIDVRAQIDWERVTRRLPAPYVWIRRLLIPGLRLCRKTRR